MTEQMAKECIQGKLDCMKTCDVFDCKNTDECDNCIYCYSQGNFGEQKKAFETAIQALEEIQQYRAIEKKLEEMFGGKLPLQHYVDELERALLEPNSPHPMNARILTYAESDMWDKYRAIGTVEELQALKEKSVAKKVKGKTHEYGNYFGRCPVCGASAVNEFSMPYKYCHDCGQRLSWE